MSQLICLVRFALTLIQHHQRSQGRCLTGGGALSACQHGVGKLRQPQTLHLLCETDLRFRIQAEPEQPFGGAPSSSNTTAYFRLHAAQRSSTGALRIDGVVFVPVESDDFTDQTSALLTYTSPSPTTGLVVDGLTKGTYYGDYGSGYPISPPPMLGGFGRLSPGQVNSLVIGTGISTVSYAVYYYPLYDIAKPPGS